MVTLLSINNLAGYKSVTPQLHGYIVVTQQLNTTDRQPTRNIFTQKPQIEKYFQ